VPNSGLDAEKLGLLNKWAEGLQRDPRAEVAAAGRAILMLIEEVERLHVVVWDERLTAGNDAEPELEAEPELTLEFIEPHEQQRERDIFRALRDRLRHARRGSTAL
jgi:hypothetical protein